jgi:hypothetical protein
MRSLYSLNTQPISEWLLNPTSKPRSYNFFVIWAFSFSALVLVIPKTPLLAFNKF